MKKISYTIIGSIFVGIGVVGIFIPLLPTTVFLLLASYFFMKSSPELNEKLLNHKHLGSYIRNYKEKKGMPIRSKITSISLLWISILLSAYYFTDSLFIRILLLIIATGVTIHIATLKNLQSQTIKD